ncbi:MAG: hypothetical protein O9288_17285 [Novosphingobium sp.]|jgi:hypothetical protein|uniref:hypothetical protein n=1 Tax=Novosphingobium sp. TaxID=1874826 RepID=UPI0022CD0809|nr:hypothetical protein [Novosphingobium sp.]MCZ8036485.1 hypothetical protein [Novosphingobium sp.]
MDGAAFKQALERLGFSQSSFAREHRLHLRTVQNWARNGPPEFLAPILNAMIRQTIDPPASQDWASPGAAAAEGKQALDMSLRSLVQRAVHAGWPREVVLASVIIWAGEKVITKR